MENMDNEDELIDAHKKSLLNDKNYGYEGSLDEKNDKFDLLIDQMPEDIWIKDKINFPFFDEILKHNFENLEGRTVVFGIHHDSFSLYSYSPGLNKRIWRSDHDVAENTNIKKIIDSTIKHFANTQADEDKMDLYVQKQVDQRNAQSKLTNSARKAGYVQGVCESVLAIDNDENRWFMTESAIIRLSKKLLSEMHVTKDMARKYASPETYKALEQGIFAQNQDQRFERAQGVKR